MPLAMAQPLSGGEFNKNIEDAMRQVQDLNKQYEARKAALDDLTLRKAPYEVLGFYEFQRRELQRKINALQSAVEGWKEQGLGDRVPPCTPAVLAEAYRVQRNRVERAACRTDRGNPRQARSKARNQCYGCVR